ncbi:fumarate hydratase C-terminal domain-containing protein, partial [Escherichia coli]|uniref:fumarate hydratase C-terminal domain-containing protein n=1 Tax=Escherichia coli TaxID=562 RepID=UPI002078F894
MRCREDRFSLIVQRQRAIQRAEQYITADARSQLFLHTLNFSDSLSLTGTIIVGRDIAHAKLKELIDAGKELPQYIKDHPIYYAGP